MKKTRFIAVILIVAVMVIGAGYAYWTQDLKITGTVNTGELKVVFANYSDNTIPNDAGYMSVETSVNNDQDVLTFKINDLYPGTGGNMAFIIKNEGTVPAKITGVEAIISDEDRALANNLRYGIHRIKYYRPFKSEPWVQFDLSNVGDFDNFENWLEYRLMNIPPLYQNILGEQLVLEPGGWLEIIAAESGYNIKMPSSVTDNDLQGKTIEFDLLLKFEQNY
ncbi:SipW-cognate class signal peptide [Natronincola peptidivorans]|uniref:SipW-cognate class signal peptide n=1 Tax=Natronincola peptidivorans TaxID=426128 RepID=A0A1H9ZZL4_9FIRM|nr:SipW-dependent-type signal peptide-containing protein [Natronincola peptidivorans]SES87096.1 SipW-cognate class signal peptide [Natronincola peptidivorans]